MSELDNTKYIKNGLILEKFRVILSNHERRMFLVIKIFRLYFTSEGHPKYILIY